MSRRTQTSHSASLLQPMVDLNRVKFWPIKSSHVSKTIRNCHQSTYEQGLSRQRYVKGKNVDKSRNPSFGEDHRHGKNLTNVARYLLPLKIAYAWRDPHKDSKTKRNCSLIRRHFAQSLLCTASPAIRSKLSTKLSTFLVESRFLAVPIRQPGRHLSQMWD